MGYQLIDDTSPTSGYTLVPDTDQTTPQQPDSLGRQAGLFARSALTGIAGIPQIITEPIRQLVTNPILGAVGADSLKGKPLTSEADKFSDWLGLPNPQNTSEKVVSKGVELGMGSAGLAGLAGTGGRIFNDAYPSVSQFLTTLGSSPATQAVSGAAGGIAGEQAKQNGAGWAGQFGSTVLGGLAGAGAMALGKGIVSGVQGAYQSLTGGGVTPQLVDQKITQILINQGVDPSAIGLAVLNKMRDDVASAMKTDGTLNDAAVARLADYARVGATPTRGALTLDPYDVTLQRNAEKIAAATGSRDAQLPQISHGNNSKLINVLDGTNPSPDAYGAGATVIGGVNAQDAALTAGKKSLYDTARSMAGGEIPLDRAPYVNAVFGGLAKENKLAFLPSNVSDMLNQISKGSVTVNGVEHPVPFDVNTLDNLKTVIATAGRATNDGNAKAALKIARDALEAMPVSPTKAQFGGNQVVTGAGADFLKGADSQAGDLMDALNKARASAKSQFDWQESAPSIQSALGGANPQTFIKNNVISPSADVADVAKLTAAAGDAGKQAIRSQVAQYLKDSAIGVGKESSAANFSGINLNKALTTLGDRKLALFFSPDEIETLKSAGRVGTYETFQPRGSAVNNSNTTAAAANLLQGISKYVKPIVKAIPMGESAVVKPLDYLTLRASESPAVNFRPGLLNAALQKAPFSNGLLAPMIYGGGLLSSPGP